MLIVFPLQVSEIAAYFSDADANPWLTPHSSHTYHLRISRVRERKSITKCKPITHYFAYAKAGLTVATHFCASTLRLVFG